MPELADEESIRAVAAEIAARKQHAETTAEADGWRRQYFDRWCERSGTSSPPATEATLLRLLHEHWDSWAHMRNMCLTVSRTHAAAGLADPVGRAVRALLKRAAQMKGRASAPLVDAMSMPELLQVCAALRGKPGGHSDRAAVWGSAWMLAAKLNLALPLRWDAVAELCRTVEVARRGLHVRGHDAGAAAHRPGQLGAVQRHV